MSTAAINPENDFEYDVFVSYSSTDKAWVRGELLNRLEAAGLRVCIDYRDFERGAPTIDEIERAVVSSAKTLAILTPAYLTSDWTAFETLLKQTLDPANRQRSLIPLLREECDDIPPRISYLTHVNFVDPYEGMDFAWRQLLTALGVPPRDEAPVPVTSADWFLPHPFAMPPNFTGRNRERDLLTDWLERDADHPLLVLEALGGFGKSALAWHWLTHDVDTACTPRVVWWSFYEGDNSFDTFLAETLAYLDADVSKFPGPRHKADELLRRLHSPGTLIVLDGFERVLRAYANMMAAYQDDGRPVEQGAQTDCVSPVAEHFLRSLCALPGIQGKVLMTTRLIPRTLTQHGVLIAGCRHEELRHMDPIDAVAFFNALGIRGARAEIEAACAPYGYHPLSLRLLAGLIVRDLRQPGDVAAAERLDVSGDLVQRQHHVLETAYDSLTSPRRRLLSRIACFRGPVDHDALLVVAQADQEEGAAEAGETDADADLGDLVDRGLLHRDHKTNRFDLHPIVRRYAYDRLTGDDRSAAHGQLRDYFAAVEKPKELTSLDDLAPVIELYHHTVRAGRFDEAFELFRNRISKPAYYQFGAYQLCIELLRSLFPDSEDQPPHLKDESAQAWTLHQLANSYSSGGQPMRAVPLYERANSIDEKQGDRGNLAIGLGTLACMAQIQIGALLPAEANLRRSIALSREVSSEYDEAIAHHEFGRLLAYRGCWAEAEQEQATALSVFGKQRKIQPQSVAAADRAHRALLMSRAGQTAADGSTLTDSALAAARRALDLADETARTQYPCPRDYVRAYWVLGTAHRAKGELDDADRHLTDSLTRCRGINMVDHEADILLDLARLRHDQGQRDLALERAAEALLITERSGYVMQGADVHLLLAQLALDDDDRPAALEHAQKAHTLATCDGPPDYTYKVAYDEAAAMLEQLQPAPDEP